ncbi:hypothetical protein, partial [Mycobacteroides abscessus]|uniref:hypothetical protein n=1 Tax=Mycobacteroides abscessus TaxID=36809 RepID=UPI001F1AD02B
LQSLGYDTPVPLIRSDSYTTLMDATRRESGSVSCKTPVVHRRVTGWMGHVDASIHTAAFKEKD